MIGYQEAINLIVKNNLEKEYLLKCKAIMNASINIG